MSDNAAWLQAFAAIIALGLSTWSVLEARATATKAREDAQADIKAQNELRAKMISSAIVVELQVLSGDLERVDEYINQLPAIITLQRRSGIDTMREGKVQMLDRTRVVLPALLERNLDRLHWLGDPVGAAMLVLVSLVFSLNGLIAKMVEDVTSPHGRGADEWLAQITPHMDLTRNTLPQVQVQVMALIEDNSSRELSPTTAPWYMRPPR